MLLFYCTVLERRIYKAKSKFGIRFIKLFQLFVVSRYGTGVIVESFFPIRNGY